MQIEAIDIKGFWNEFDIHIPLQPDVTILLGINGSGKSTIMRMVHSMLQWDTRFPARYCQQATLHLNDGQLLRFEWVETDEGKMPSIFFQRGSLDIVRIGNERRLSITDERHEGEEISVEDMQLARFSLISTFDGELKEREAIQKLTYRSVRTELDWELWQLEKQYLAYQITIGERIERLLAEDSTDDIRKASLRIREKKHLFEQIINELFAKTNKTIGTNERKEIVFFQQGKEVLPYGLSSGEKQILLILLKVLLQDGQPHLLLMDEPEISMHLSWQVDLIEHISRLNEHSQVLIATHAPAVMKKGWKDRILRMEDLMKPL
jgi:predicted ATPase